ncbi:hypothetical protein B4168_0178 [Anoxybacillus flavithermus]|nr:hypothetical protein B4168_0178 [Anoxybacillus flavithermus]
MFTIIILLFRKLSNYLIIEYEIFSFLSIIYQNKNVWPYR